MKASNADLTELKSQQSGASVFSRLGSVMPGSPRWRTVSADVPKIGSEYSWLHAEEQAGEIHIQTIMHPVIKIYKLVQAIRIDRIDNGITYGTLIDFRVERV